MRKAKNKRLAEKRAAFEAAVAQHEAGLLRYAARVLSDPVAAQDVVQETFLKLFRKWDQVVKPNANLSSWLYRVTHNGAIDCIRRRQRRQHLHLKQDAERQVLRPRDADPSKDCRLHEQVQDALACLDLRERQLVLLKVYEGKSYQEMSEITGLSSGNIGYILHHAIKKMANRISETRKTREQETS